MIASYLPAGFEKQAMQQLKIELLDFANTHLPEGTDFEIHVGHGHVAETILRVADKHKVDLIVMASHPPNELQTFLVGSQAGKVVRNAAVPVMVVR